MVSVVNQKVLFGRDQVVTSTQASKNFGEVRRKARTQPLFVSDRNDGIDTVIMCFDEFESMAAELESLREELFYAKAAARLAGCADSETVLVEQVIGEEAFDRLVSEESNSLLSDQELFE